MPTVKGPFKLNKKNADEFIEKNVSNISLPFKAKGWKSSKNEKFIPSDQKKPKKTEKKESKKESKKEPKKDSKKKR